MTNRDKHFLHGFKCAARDVKTGRINKIEAIFSYLYGTKRKHRTLKMEASQMGYLRGVLAAFGE